MIGNYRFADVVFRIEYQYDYFGRYAEKYEIGESVSADWEISITENDIRKEAERQGSTNAGRDYLMEPLAIYRKICEKLVMQDVLLIHASAISFDGKAYLFLAPSGTGKSTHTRLWRECFGDRTFMINDDKPLIRIGEKEVLAYGSPWNGKHHLDTNASVPIAGICFLERGAENHIRRVSGADGFPWLMRAIYRPDDEVGSRKTLELTFALARKIPTWKMECNMDPEAARMAAAQMSGMGHQRIS